MNENYTHKLGFLENSHRFLAEAANKAILAQEDSDQWLFAVSALVQSVELALKAALAQIHPILIFENIDNPKRSVTIGTATNRLLNKKIGKYILSKKDLARLKKAIEIRNQITHSDFSINIRQIESNFHEIFAFLAEFNRKTFAIGMDEVVNPSYLVEFLKNHKHHQEMLIRAIKHIEDDQIEPHLIRACPMCDEDTFIEYEENFKCCLCHHEEVVVVCPRCNETLTEPDLEDFSEEFQADFSEGYYDVRHSYGYDYHKACYDCTLEIKEHIHQMELENEYQEMMEADWYLKQDT